MFDRINSAAVAVALGFLVWLYARSRDQETLDNVLIPVQIELAASQADHYDLEVTGSAQVVASFSGPPSRMKELRGQLQRGELRVSATLTVPPDRQEEGRYLDTVRIDSADIHPPPGVRPIVVEGRNRVPVTLRRIVERRLPVRFEHSLEDRLQQATVEPDSVQVRGPQDVLDRIRALPTELYTRPAPADSGSLEASKAAAMMPLVHEIEGRSIKSSPAAVAVQLTFRPRQKEYLVDVPVQFLCPPSFPYRPKWEDERAGKITLRVVGPTGLEPPAVIAFIDLTGKKYDQGFYADEPFRLQLAKEFQLAQSLPRSGAFRLVPVTERADGPGVGGVRPP